MYRIGINSLKTFMKNKLKKKNYQLFKITFLGNLLLSPL